MPHISTTRMELLAHKERLALAQQGSNLLEKKRTVMMREFFNIVEIVMANSEMLRLTANRAGKALARAEAFAGSEAVRSAGLASRQEFPLKISFTNVMGMRVPQIEQRSAARPFYQRGYAITGTSTLIDEAAYCFEEQVNAILQLAESELHLERLAGEIHRTSRRLNALDNVLIPRLEEEVRYIQRALDERERSDHFRLKLIKRALERKREPTAPAP